MEGMLEPHVSPCSGADDSRYAVSCLNTVKTDWKKGVQLWACPQDANPAQVRGCECVLTGIFTGKYSLCCLSCSMSAVGV